MGKTIKRKMKNHIVGNGLDRSACNDTTGSKTTNGMVKTIPYVQTISITVIS